MKTVNELVGELKAAQGLVKSLRVAIREQRIASRVGRSEAIAARKAQIEAKRVARISALEARLESLRAKAVAPKTLKKASRKASPVKLISKDAA
jgi:hypothetical protein